MRGRLRALRLRLRPLTRFARKRSQIDLSPHAGQGCLNGVASLALCQIQDVDGRNI
jgi:hypothetical protein